MRLRLLFNLLKYTGTAVYDDYIHTTYTLPIRLLSDNIQQ